MTQSLRQSGRAERQDSKEAYTSVGDELQDLKITYIRLSVKCAKRFVEWQEAIAKVEANEIPHEEFMEYYDRHEAVQSEREVITSRMKECLLLIHVPVPYRPTLTTEQMIEHATTHKHLPHFNGLQADAERR